jgi:hypothetical protein
MGQANRHPITTDKSQTAAELPRLLTEKEIARYLRVSRDAITRFKRRRNDPIPFEKAGRRCLYDLAAVRAWTRRSARSDRLSSDAFGSEGPVASAGEEHAEPDAQAAQRSTP